MLTFLALLAAGTLAGEHAHAVSKDRPTWEFTGTLSVGSGGWSACGDLRLLVGVGDGREDILDLDAPAWLEARDGARIEVLVEAVRDDGPLAELSWHRLRAVGSEPLTANHAGEISVTFFVPIRREALSERETVGVAGAFVCGRDVVVERFGLRRSDLSLRAAMR